MNPEAGSRTTRRSVEGAVGRGRNVLASRIPRRTAERWAWFERRHHHPEGVVAHGGDSAARQRVQKADLISREHERAGSCAGAGPQHVRRRLRVGAHVALHRSGLAQVDVSEGVGADLLAGRSGHLFHQPWRKVLDSVRIAVGPPGVEPQGGVSVPRAPRDPREVVVPPLAGHRAHARPGGRQLEGREEFEQRGYDLPNPFQVCAIRIRAVSLRVVDSPPEFEVEGEEQIGRLGRGRSRLRSDRDQMAAEGSEPPPLVDEVVVGLDDLRDARPERPVKFVQDSHRTPQTALDPHVAGSRALEVLRDLVGRREFTVRVMGVETLRADELPCPLKQVEPIERVAVHEGQKCDAAGLEDPHDLLHPLQHVFAVKVSEHFDRQLPGRRCPVHREAW